MSDRRHTVALLGGTFNPVHVGHMMVASYVAQWCREIDEVWLVLSPLSPLKVDSKNLIASDADRYEMLRIATSGSTVLKASDVELHLPRPSYTFDTLTHLSGKYPDYSFKWIIGSDNLSIIDKWYRSSEIIRHYGLIVYPRPGYPVKDIPAHLSEYIQMVDSPTVDLSSTWIRKAIAQGRDVNFFLPSGVYEYIKSNKLYLNDPSE